MSAHAHHTESGTVELLAPERAEALQRRAAAVLAARGLRPGDRVTVALGSSADLLCLVLGALRTGVIPVLLNATLLPAERDELVADAEPSLCVLEPDALSALLAEAAPEGPDLAPVPLGRPMHYTSGTTGRAKGVWSGVWAEETARRAFEDERSLWGFGPADVHLVCSPMYHSVSIRFAGGTLLAGGSVIVLGHFDAATAVDVLRNGHGGVRPTTTFMAPTALGRVLAVDEEALRGLRLVVHAGSPCPPGLKARALAHSAPGALHEFYGSTEGQFTVCGPDEARAHPGSVGRARPLRTISVDDDGHVWCAGPDFTRFEYWRDPEKTAAAWRDGAFTVGDLGHLDAEGYLHLDGRRDDLIISGGVNVYPADVEHALEGVPGVAEVAVFGADDEAWGQRVCVAYVPEAGEAADLADVEAALVARAAERLAPYKRPKAHVALPALPHTATGKLQRGRLAAMAAGSAPPPDPAPAAPMGDD